MLLVWTRITEALRTQAPEALVDLRGAIEVKGKGLVSPVGGRLAHG